MHTFQIKSNIKQHLHGAPSTSPGSGSPSKSSNGLPSNSSFILISSIGAPSKSSVSLSLVSTNGYKYTS